jgi:integrase
MHRALWLAPRAEAEKLGPFVNDPADYQPEDATLYAHVLLLLMFTGVRSTMITRLRWRNIKDEEGEGYIEYLPATDDSPSEHKMGWEGEAVYIVMLTDNIRAIIEAERQRQIKHGIKIKPDGFVFVHGRSRASLHFWGRPTNRTHINKALKRIARTHPEVKKKNVTVQGIRTAFTTWATKAGYSDNLINLTLGHEIPAVKNNRTNRSYFYRMQLIDERREMMEDWDRYCLSLCDKPQRARTRASNVVRIPRRRAS